MLFQHLTATLTWIRLPDPLNPPLRPSDTLTRPAYPILAFVQTQNVPNHFPENRRKSSTVVVAVVVFRSCLLPTSDTCLRPLGCGRQPTLY